MVTLTVLVHILPTHLLPRQRYAFDGLVALTVAVPAGNYDGSLSQMILS